MSLLFVSWQVHRNKVMLNVIVLIFIRNSFLKCKTFTEIHFMNKTKYKNFSNKKLLNCGNIWNMNILTIYSEGCYSPNVDKCVYVLISVILGVHWCIINGVGNTCTIIWELFIVEIFSWLRRTTKIKNMNIYVQQKISHVSFSAVATTTTVT